MNKSTEMHDKFLMLAEKLWISPEVIDKIKEDFWKVKVTTVEVSKEPEDSPEKWEENRDKNKIDIAKPVEMKIPSEEDISKMSPEEVMVLAKMLIRKNLEKENKSSPFMEMIKKQWY